MLQYDSFRNWRFDDIEFANEERDVVLYALGIGFGMDPSDEDQLRFVHEDRLEVVPSMATIIGYPGPWWRMPELGVNWRKVLHGDQDLELFAPLPVKGRIVGRNRITCVHDQGADKYALVQVERDIIDKESGVLLARGRRISVLRGDGGFSSQNGKSDPAPQQLPPIMEDGCAAQYEISLPTSPQAALIYRLSGDYNPRHALPKAARESGFDGPIMHGLCTYGVATHAALRCLCGYDISRLSRLAARFAAPVYPGETIRFQFWPLTANGYRFRATVDERKAVVLDRGIVELFGTHR